jgi:hypothetical protein
LASSKSVVRSKSIQERILLIRGERVIVDADLAHFYGVSTKRLNEQVRRNKARFPVDFMFRLTVTEKAEVVANCDHLVNLKFSKTLPIAFTEHGAIMAASILNSTRADELSVFVVRAFIALRHAIVGNKQLVEKMAQLERRLSDHDQQILAIVRAIKQLASTEPIPKKRRIGFEP